MTGNPDEAVAAIAYVPPTSGAPVGVEMTVTTLGQTIWREAVEEGCWLMAWSCSGAAISPKRERPASAKASKKALRVI